MSGRFKQISRRRFLGILGMLAVASLLTARLFESRRGRLLARLRAFYYERTDPRLQTTPTGSLNPQTLDVLQATTRALLDTPVEMRHYASYFEWRSENLPGYRSLYEAFAVTLNEAATRTAQLPFVECDISVQRKILERVDLDRRGRWALVAGIFDSNWLRFEKYVVREILELFVRTDGWVLLGYESWPGTPRGLERYTKAPEPRPKAA
jgi:hypothetical protein